MFIYKYFLQRRHKAFEGNTQQKEYWRRLTAKDHYVFGLQMEYWGDWESWEEVEFCRETFQQLTRGIPSSNKGKSFKKVRHLPIQFFRNFSPTACSLREIKKFRSKWAHLRGTFRNLFFLLKYNFILYLRVAK